MIKRGTALSKGKEISSVLSRLVSLFQNVLRISSQPGLISLGHPLLFPNNSEVHRIIDDPPLCDHEEVRESYIDSLTLLQYYSRQITTWLHSLHTPNAFPGTTAGYNARTNKHRSGKCLSNPMKPIRMIVSIAEYCFSASSQSFQACITTPIIATLSSGKHPNTTLNKSLNHAYCSLRTIHCTAPAISTAVVRLGAVTSSGPPLPPTFLKRTGHAATSFRYLSSNVICQGCGPNEFNGIALTNASRF